MRVITPMTSSRGGAARNYVITTPWCCWWCGCTPSPLMQVSHTPMQLTLPASFNPTQRFMCHALVVKSGQAAASHTIPEIVTTHDAFFDINWLGSVSPLRFVCPRFTVFASSWSWSWSDHSKGAQYHSCGCPISQQGCPISPSSTNPFRAICSAGMYACPHVNLIALCEQLLPIYVSCMQTFSISSLVSVLRHGISARFLYG